MLQCIGDVLYVGDNTRLKAFVRRDDEDVDVTADCIEELLSGAAQVDFTTMLLKDSKESLMKVVEPVVLVRGMYLEGGVHLYLLYSFGWHSLESLGLLGHQQRRFLNHHFYRGDP